MAQQAGATKKKSPVVLIVAIGAVVLCVPCIGVLAAIAIPAFIGYTKKAKIQEAESNLEAMFVAAAGYYGEERFASTGPQSFCTVDPAITPNVPGPHKQVITTWPQSFVDMGFAPGDPVYFQYEIEGPPSRCGHQPDSMLYTFRARGDLDGDGVQSLIELSAGSSSMNELYRAPGIYRENELE